MSIAEEQALDMSILLSTAYELGDRINMSAAVADYKKWQLRLATDADAQRLIRTFARKKELFAECERFGHFHPDYHRAKQEAEAIQQEMDACEAIRSFKLAEQALDELLHDVSKTIAHSVSATIKVPGNEKANTGSSCGTGGCGGNCSGGCS
ncbi:YlbF family regulator [Paenibacillus cymbidii]|uniref:YlbF family regulator n=1 Tax=Paenibacillus cymbidii TaxID=1639034 RepID=UPI001080B8D1|nr:YlbF family regulator [Paenibacillus cymbidii]